MRITNMIFHSEQLKDSEKFQAGSWKMKKKEKSVMLEQVENYRNMQKIKHYKRQYIVKAIGNNSAQINKEQ